MKQFSTGFLVRVAALVLAGLFSLQPLRGQEKSVLPEHHVLGKIRVFYATEGPSAVPLADLNGNGVPDRVEDVAKQMWAAHRLFCEVLEFPDPCNSERYPGVTCIQVSIRERSEIGGSNGLAYHVAQRARLIPEGTPEDRALTATIGHHVVASKNPTPGHEIFHLIQYSSTNFKNRWFLEGMARWSERALHKDAVGDVKYSPLGPWPQQPANVAALFDMTYDAEYVLWNPIAMGTDRKGVLPATPVVRELAALRYSDGSPVLQDLYLAGAEIMREILLELGKMDAIAFQEIGHADWSQDNRMSPKNNPYVYQAVMDVLRRRSTGVGPFQVTNGPTIAETPAVDTSAGLAAADQYDEQQPAGAGAESAARKAAAIEAAKWRTWTTADGKYRVEAKFVKFARDMLTLEKKDGTTVDVRLDILTPDDQSFVKQRRWSKAVQDE